MQPLVNNASAQCVGELDNVIEQLRNHTRRCRSDVDGLLRASEETGSLNDEASRAIATANATLSQAEQQMQQVAHRLSSGLIVVVRFVLVEPLCLGA